MAQDLFVGIDVGGTSVKVGLVDADGNIIAKQSVPTPPLTDDAGYSAVIDGIASTVKQAGAELSQLKGIGLDLPCPIPDEGLPAIVANMELDLPGLKQALEAAYADSKIVLLNDANAAAMGEVWKGAAAGRKSMVMITIGTGVGGGIVIDGKVIGGFNGAAGELGHLTVNLSEERTCGCGRHGCLEQYASATGVVSNYLRACERAGVEPIELDGPSDSRNVFQACREGDELALEAMSGMASALGYALANITLTVDPEAIVIGGGASASADVFLEPLTQAYKKFALASCVDTPLVVASLGNDAGLLGAAYSAILATKE